MDYDMSKTEFFRYITESDDLRIPKHSKVYNLDRWGQTYSTNTLCITGVSGAGKSTLAKSMESSQVEVIHLDSYFDNENGPKNAAFNKHLIKYLPGYKKLSLPKDKISLEHWCEVVELFEEELLEFSVTSYKNGKKVVVEGVHLLDDTLYPDKSFFIGKPLIIIRGGMISSIRHGNKRDGIRFSFSNVKDYRRWEKDVKRLVGVLESDYKI